MPFQLISLGEIYLRISFVFAISTPGIQRNGVKAHEDFKNEMIQERNREKAEGTVCNGRRSFLIQQR